MHARQVPYEQLRRAERELGERFPNATRVKGLWTPASRVEIHVEVWTGHGTANVFGWEATR